LLVFSIFLIIFRAKSKDNPDFQHHDGHAGLKISKRIFRAYWKVLGYNIDIRCKMVGMQVSQFVVAFVFY